MNASAPVMWDIVEEHLGEAAFLWSQWSLALVAPNQQPVQVAARSEKRLLAHLDALGLLNSRDLGGLFESASGEMGKLFALGLVHAEKATEGPLAFTRLLEDDTPAIELVVGQALGLCRRTGVEAALEELVQSGDPRWQAAGLSALSLRDRAPETPRLQPLLASKVPAVRAAALRCARFAGSGLRPFVEAALTAEPREVRDAALETGLVLGLRAAYLTARKVAESGGPHPELPLALLAMGGDLRDLDLVVSALAKPELRQPALRALGSSGWPAAAEQSVAHLGDEEVGKIAGEAFCAITGLVLSGPFQRPETEGNDAPVPLEAEDLDADLAPKPEQMLAPPDPDRVGAWWQRERGRFDAKKRYLAGKPFSAETLVAALQTGPMYRRRWLALELSVRSWGVFQLETCFWVGDQLRRLRDSQFRAASNFTVPFPQLFQS